MRQTCYWPLTLVYMCHWSLTAEAQPAALQAYMNKYQYEMPLYLVLTKSWHEDKFWLSLTSCDFLLNSLFRLWSNFRVTGLCAGNSPVIPTQRASYAENVSIWWRHHEIRSFMYITPFNERHIKYLYDSLLDDIYERLICSCSNANV